MCLIKNTVIEKMNINDFDFFFPKSYITQSIKNKRRRFKILVLNLCSN